MSKDVFITDERLSFSKILSTTLEQKSYKVLLTSENSNEKTIQWNKNTPFALQHLNIELKTRDMDLDIAIIIFDAIEYGKLFASNSLIGIDKTCTELITAYANLVLILQTIMLKQEYGRLIFVWRVDENARLENYAVNMASVAFAKLAENTSQALYDKKIPKLQSLLLRLENADKNSANWLASQLELSVLSRNVAKWVKAGSRSFFSI